MLFRTVPREHWLI